MNKLEGSRNAANVCGVIVTYHPTAEMLQALLDAVRPQLTRLVIVDNGSEFNFAKVLAERAIDLVELGDNFGIAHAQNVGIEHARSHGAELVLLMDQDSVPAPDMVHKLHTTLGNLASSGLQVAAVGPSYLDERQGEAAPFVYLDGLKLRRRVQIGGEDIAEADFLIASGCLIPIQVLDAVGPMTDELFIDYVDIEWGLRARQLGYRSYGVYSARMMHTLGDEWVEFRDRRVPVHSPLRHYYHARNAIWLVRRPWISAQWRLVLLWRLIRQSLFFSVFVPQRFEHAKMMSLGVWHGLRDRMGRK